MIMWTYGVIIVLIALVIHTASGMAIIAGAPVGLLASIPYTEQFICFMADVAADFAEGIVDLGGGVLLAVYERK